MLRLGLATNQDWPNLCDDDAPLVPLLCDQNILAEPVRWDDRAVDWQIYDAVIVRSVWDYVQRFPEFLAWLAKLDEKGVPLWNPTSLCRWNARKTYLRDMATLGVRTVPTVWVEKQQPIDLRRILEEQSWRDAVVKPVVSAAGDRTHRLHLDDVDAGQALVDDLVRQRDLMIQPFITDVIDRGEWSLIYLGGRYSHAVRKVAATGEFRVQEEHGGKTEGAEAPAALIASADEIARKIPYPWLFARIDGFEDEQSGEMILAELEALEPLLFLSYDGAAHERFADAIAARLHQ